MLGAAWASFKERGVVMSSVLKDMPKNLPLDVENDDDDDDDIAVVVDVGSP